MNISLYLEGKGMKIHLYSDVYINYISLVTEHRSCNRTTLNYYQITARTTDITVQILFAGLLDTLSVYIHRSV